MCAWVCAHVCSKKGLLRPSDSAPLPGSTQIPSVCSMSRKRCQEPLGPKDAWPLMLTALAPHCALTLP